MRKWLTPDVAILSEAKDCRVVQIPGNLWPLVSGALLELTRAYNWEQFGDATPEETADYFYLVYEGFLMSQCAYIGEVRAFSGTTPDKWLALDGAAVAQADYVDLTAVVPASWLSGSDIILPDMSGRSIVGVGSGYALGDSGGEESHTLTTDEMPAHTHGYEVAVLTADIAGELPAPALNALAPSVTDSAGNGQSHNNMPPYLVLNWAIYAGVG